MINGLVQATHLDRAQRWVRQAWRWVSKVSIRWSKNRCKSSTKSQIKITHFINDSLFLYPKNYYQISNLQSIFPLFLPDHTYLSHGRSLSLANYVSAVAKSNKSPATSYSSLAEDIIPTRWIRYAYWKENVLNYRNKRWDHNQAYALYVGRTKVHLKL
jgi:hypothetical protein